MEDDSTRVFIPSTKGVPEAELVLILGQIGPITSFNLHSKGFAFVTFSDPGAAAAAIASGLRTRAGVLPVRAFSSAATGEANKKRWGLWVCVFLLLLTYVIAMFLQVGYMGTG